MTSLAIVDTGPLVGAAVEDDDHHAASLAVLARSDLRYVVPAFVAAEATYLVGQWLSPQAEARPDAADWGRIADLIEQFADFPLGAADASVVALAERLGTDVVVTFDRRHFPAIRPKHRDHLTLLP